MKGDRRGQEGTAHIKSLKIMLYSCPNFQKLAVPSCSLLSPWITGTRLALRIGRYLIATTNLNLTYHFITYRVERPDEAKEDLAPPFVIIVQGSKESGKTTDKVTSTPFY